MVVRCVRVLIIFLLSLGCGQSRAGDDSGNSVNNVKVFWKNRPELFRIVEKERAILVSVKRSESDSGWIFVGGGHVRSDFETSWKVARQYEKLSQLTWLFNKVRFESSSEKLFLGINFLGLKKDLVVKLSEQKLRSGGGSIDFQIDQGFFRGLKGHVDFSSYLPDTTEVEVNAQYYGDTPWPHWLFAPGAEAVMHYTASELRTLIEREKAKPTVH